MEQREQLLQIARQMGESGRMNVEDLPDLDLYMDQVVTLLEQGLGDTRRTKGEKLLTNTMLGNYTKEGLLKKIRGKKYPREHLLMMILLYHLKQSLALGDVKALFGLVEEKLSADRCRYDPVAVEEVFRTFSEMQRQQAGQFQALLEQGVKDFDLGADRPEDLLATVLWLCNLSNLAAATARRLIDATAGESVQE